MFFRCGIAYLDAKLKHPLQGEGIEPQIRKSLNYDMFTSFFRKENERKENQINCLVYN